MQGAQNRSLTPRPKARADPVKEAKGKGEGKGKQNLAGLHDAVCRANFLKKVYGLLACQLLFTAGVAAICMYVQGIRQALCMIYQQYNSTLRWGVFIPTLVSLIVLKSGAKDRYPSNYIWLSTFTICISINVGYVCAIFEEVGSGHLVLQAFCMTSMIFLGLTMYTLYSGKDFSYLGAFLSVLLWGLTLSGLVAFFFPGLTQSVAFGFIGALTFCGYILYDTSCLVKKLTYDDYIVGAIELYLDIINLFLYILEILAKMSKEDKKKK
jgi:FtsH-binding integral membrane protein